MNLDREMQRALRADGEKLRQLTGEDHGPQQLFTCEACDGKGYTAHRITVYEAGCGFAHDDVDERSCEECGGLGWFVGELKADDVVNG